MESDAFFFDSNLGEVLIARNDERPGLWDLSIDDKLISPAYYTCPDRAAFCASRRDFGDEELNERCKRLRVPDDLRLWRPCKLSRASD